MLDPSIFTIGFARRFATYKRAGLLFTDVDRLARLLTDEERPVQIIFAGKAHPADRPGQQVIQEIFTLSRSPELRGRVFILEDYDMRIARFLVQGVDVWLNKPRRPLEASGTSGMKAAINGVVEPERPRRLVGRGLDRATTAGRSAIASRTATRPPQDWADAQDLYRLLEEEIVPRYYERDEDGMPMDWVEPMRRVDRDVRIWQFSTTRMLHEYVEQMYLPAVGIEVAPRPRSTAASATAEVATRQLTAAARRACVAQPGAHARVPMSAPRPGSRSRSRSTTTSPSATSAGCSRRSSSRPTSRWSTPLERHPTVRARAALHRARCSSGSRAERPTFIDRRAALVDRGQVEILGGGLLRAGPGVAAASATGSASCAHGATSSRRSSGAAAAARGSRNGSGSRRCRRRSPTRATRWTILDDLHLRAAGPRRGACGGRTPPTTRAGG